MSAFVPPSQSPPTPPHHHLPAQGAWPGLLTLTTPHRLEGMVPAGELGGGGRPRCFSIMFLPRPFGQSWSSHPNRRGGLTSQPRGRAHVIRTRRRGLCLREWRVNPGPLWGNQFLAKARQPCSSPVPRTHHFLSQTPVLSPSPPALSAWPDAYPLVPRAVLH